MCKDAYQPISFSYSLVIKLAARPYTCCMSACTIVLEFNFPKLIYLDLKELLFFRGFLHGIIETKLWAFMNNESGGSPLRWILTWLLAVAVVGGCALDECCILSSENEILRRKREKEKKEKIGRILITANMNHRARLESYVYSGPGS